VVNPGDEGGGVLAREIWRSSAGPSQRSAAAVLPPLTDRAQKLGAMTKRVGVTLRIQRNYVAVSPLIVRPLTRPPFLASLWEKTAGESAA
jgi:hypothetical protein